MGGLKADQGDVSAQANPVSDSGGMLCDVWLHLPLICDRWASGIMARRSCLTSHGECFASPQQANSSLQHCNRLATRPCRPFTVVSPDMLHDGNLACSILFISRSYESSHDCFNGIKVEVHTLIKRLPKVAKIICLYATYPFFFSSFIWCLCPTGHSSMMLFSVLVDYQPRVASFSSGFMLSQLIPTMASPRPVLASAIILASLK